MDSSYSSLDFSNVVRPGDVVIAIHDQLDGRKRVAKAGAVGIVLDVEPGCLPNIAWQGGRVCGAVPGTDFACVVLP